MYDKAQCRRCMARKPNELTSPITRRGGGTYRRPDRRYHTTICLDCIVALIGERSEPKHAMETVDRYPFRSLVAARDRIRAKVGQ